MDTTVSIFDYFIYTNYNIIMKRLLYHGSTEIIEKPTFGFGNKHNDYGLGFYCSSDIEISKEWASRKQGFGYVNKYTIRDDRLNILDLTKGDNNNVLMWINLLIQNRSVFNELKTNYPKEIEYLNSHYYIDISSYDVIIGYRADDSYFRFPESFIKNEITLKSLETIYLSGGLGKQYVLISKRAFKLLKFDGYLETNEVYKRGYYSRKDAANKLYKDLIINDRYSSDTKILDLIKNDERNTR